MQMLAVMEKNHCLEQPIEICKFQNFTNGLLNAVDYYPDDTHLSKFMGWWKCMGQTKKADTC